MCFWSESWIDNATVLAPFVDQLRKSRVSSDIEVDLGWWSDRDVSLAIGPNLRLDVRGLVEDHGAGKCLLRARLRLRGVWLIALLVAIGAAAGLSGVANDGWQGTALLALAACASVALVRIFSHLIDATAIACDAITRVAGQFGMVDLRPDVDAPSTPVEEF